MAKPTLISIGPRERYWANTKSWQRFWGTYELQESTGLYVEQGSSPTHLKNLARAFRKLPKEIRETARQWRVTFNFAELFTASGNSSTFYGDFSRSRPEDVSPHVEMGKTSLSAPYILGHLCHELCHLFWRTRSEEEREAYRQFLRETCGKGTVELTEYVQERFQTYLKTAKSQSPAHAWQKNHILEAWVEESFCDTMAALIDPDYPSLEEGSTVDLETRRLVIATTFGVHFAPAPAGDGGRAGAQ